MTEPRASRADVQRIRTLFSDARASYDVAESAELLGVSVDEIRRHIDERAVTALFSGEEVRIRWADLVGLGLDERWGYRLLTDALRGNCGAAHLPSLVRVVRGTLLLPSYQWKVLPILAAQWRCDQGRAWTASDIVEKAISDVLGDVTDWSALEAAIPGVRAASTWPERDFEEDACAG